MGQSKNTYTLTTDRIIANVQKAVRSKRNEIELYRLKDADVKQGIADKVRGIGEIKVTSTDPGDPILVMKAIKNPQEVADTIKNAARAKKERMNISYRQDI